MDSYLNVYVGQLFTAASVQYQVFKFNAAASSSLTPDFALCSVNANYRAPFGIMLLNNGLQLIQFTQYATTQKLASVNVASDFKSVTLKWILDFPNIKFTFLSSLMAS